MKRLLVSASLCVCVALGVLSTACSGPNGGQLLPASGTTKTISAGGGAGVPSSIPQPPLPPGIGDCVKFTAGSVSNPIVTNVNNKLSAANVTFNFTAASCQAKPELIGLQYTVSNGLGPNTPCGNVATPVPAGSVSLGGSGGKSVTIVVPVPNCPGNTRLYTVTLSGFVPEGPFIGQPLSSISSFFEETDLTPNSPGVQNNIYHLIGTFVPDPASSPLPAAIDGSGVTNIPVTFDLPLGSFATLNWYIATGYQNGFIGAFLNGTYWGTDINGIGNTGQMRTDLTTYLQPCDPTQGPALCGIDGGGFNTRTEMHAGDKVEFFPIANNPSSFLLAPLLTNTAIQQPTIAGPRLGSAIMQLVAN